MRGPGKLIAPSLPPGPRTHVAKEDHHRPLHERPLRDQTTLQQTGTVWVAEADEPTHGADADRTLLTDDEAWYLDSGATIHISKNRLDFIDSTSDQCRMCIEGKQCLAPYPQKSLTAVARIGDMTVSDVWGPAHIRGIHSEFYFTQFTDKKSRHRVLYFAPDKGHQLENIKPYRAFLKTQTGKLMKTLCVDNGKEYINGTIKQYL